MSDKPRRYGDGWSSGRNLEEVKFAASARHAIEGWDELQETEGKWSPAKTLLFIVSASTALWALILLPVFLVLL
jgi:hypothetical protein